MAKLLLVRQSEWPRLSYFFLLFFVISAGLAIGRGTADALFLKRFGIQYLPAMYLALGVLMLLISTVYAAYADRLSPERAFYIMLGGLALMLSCNWLLMALRVDLLAYPLYFLAFEISSELLFMHATLYFSANFDGEQSKRLLPMTLAGLQLGEMCGGLLLTASPVIGVQGMVLVWSGLTAAAMAIVAVRHRSVGVSPFFHPGGAAAGCSARSTRSCRVCASRDAHRCCCTRRWAYFSWWWRFIRWVTRHTPCTTQRSRAKPSSASCSAC
jgi:hypothetical protein